MVGIVVKPNLRHSAISRESIPPLLRVTILTIVYAKLCDPLPARGSTRSAVLKGRGVVLLPLDCVGICFG